MTATQTAPDLWPLFRDYLCSAYKPPRQTAQLEWCNRHFAKREDWSLDLSFVEVTLHGRDKPFGAYRLCCTEPYSQGEILFSHNSNIITYPYPDNASFQSVGIWLTDPGEMDDWLKTIYEDAVFCIREEERRSPSHPTKLYTDTLAQIDKRFALKTSSARQKLDGILTLPMDSIASEYANRRKDSLERALANQRLSYSKTNEIINDPANDTTNQMRIAANNPDNSDFHIDNTIEVYMDAKRRSSTAIWQKGFIASERGNGTTFVVNKSETMGVLCPPFAIASFCSVFIRNASHSIEKDSPQSFLRKDAVSHKKGEEHLRGARHGACNDWNGRLVSIFDSCAAPVAINSRNPMQLRSAYPRGVS